MNSLYKAFLAILIVIIATACDDTLDKVGFTIQPDKDRLKLGMDTLNLRTRTVEVGDFFAKTKYPVLGEYADPVFGSIKSDYIGEFYYPTGAGFKDGAIVDSARVVISYSSILGDSLTPMLLDVYKVTKPLQGQTIDPAEFVDLSAPIGSKSFTGRNSTYRNVTQSSGRGTETFRVYDIRVPLAPSVATDFLNEYKKPGHGRLTDTDAFKEFFPGLYFTTSFGNGTILNVSLTSLYIHYHYVDKGGSSKGTDTTRVDALRLNITPEVTQINYIENNNDQLLVPNNTHTYVKSPAGVNTEIVFPFSEIHSKLEAQALNMAKLNIFAKPDPTQETTVKLSPPQHLLLINKDSLDGFFEKRKLPDNFTSYISTFQPTTYSYSFTNISAMVNHYKSENKNATTGKYEPFDLTYYLIPVDVTFATDQYGRPTSQPIAVYNQMQPAAVMLDTPEQKLKLEMIFSNF